MVLTHGGVRCIFDRKYDQFRENDRVLEKKMSSFEKISKSISKVRKKFPKLDIFLPERDLFHEIDHIFLKIFEKVAFCLKIFKSISNVRAVFQHFGSKGPVSGHSPSYSN